ncbi:hypothetical protein Tco_0285793 [Tanacetum coccineum]
MSEANKQYFHAEKESYFLALTGIGDEIYSTVMHATLLMKCGQPLKDYNRQYQNEVNDIRTERIAKSANPLALLAAAQPYSDNYYQAPKPQRSNATTSSTSLLRGINMQKEFALPPLQVFSRSLQTYQQQPSILLQTPERDEIPTTQGMQQNGYNPLTCKGLATMQRNAEAKAGVKTTLSQEKMMMCKQAKQGVPQQDEQAD